jgi:hypothetical protein
MHIATVKVCPASVHIHVVPSAVAGDDDDCRCHRKVTVSPCTASVAAIPSSALRRLQDAWQPDVCQLRNRQLENTIDRPVQLYSVHRPHRA